MVYFLFYIKTISLRLNVLIFVTSANLTYPWFLMKNMLPLTTKAKSNLNYYFYINNTFLPTPFFKQPK